MLRQLFSVTCWKTFGKTRMNQYHLRTIGFPLVYLTCNDIMLGLFFQIVIKMHQLQGNVGYTYALTLTCISNFCFASENEPVVAVNIDDDEDKL